jgi:hypothetical protein
VSDQPGYQLTSPHSPGPSATAIERYLLEQAMMFIAVHVRFEAALRTQARHRATSEKCHVQTWSTAEIGKGKAARQAAPQFCELHDD